MPHTGSFRGFRSSVARALSSDALTDDVPEILAEVIKPGSGVDIPDPANIILSRLTLSFWESSKRCSVLELAFQRRQAARYRFPLRALTIIFLVVNIALLGYDYGRFVRPAVESCQNQDAFVAALVLRLGIMAPMCILVISYTGTPWYSRSAQPLAVFFFILGGYLVAYSIIGRDPGYGTLALLIVYLYSFTPISFWINSIICALLNVSFGIGLRFTPTLPRECTSGQTSLSSSSNVYVGFDIMGVLIAFTLIVGFMGHNLEYWLRASFLDEYRLQMETYKLVAEQALSQNLLNSMLPKTVIAELEQGRPLIADQIPEVTVLFCELQFNFYSNTPETVVSVLNLVYSAFDSLLDVTGVHKIETVGEVYLCVGGCPIQSPNHAVIAAEMALGMMASLPELRRRVLAEIGPAGDEINIRVGLHSGPVAAGVVGIKNPRYKLIGDTVNTASRMESTCLPGCIQISTPCKRALEISAPNLYSIKERGEVAVKGKGKMITHWLEGRAGETAIAPGGERPTATSTTDIELTLSPHELAASPVVHTPIAVTQSAVVAPAGPLAVPAPELNVAASVAHAPADKPSSLTLAALVELNVAGGGMNAAMALSLPASSIARSKRQNSRRHLQPTSASSRPPTAKQSSARPLWQLSGRPAAPHNSGRHIKQPSGRHSVQNSGRPSIHGMMRSMPETGEFGSVLEPPQENDESEVDEEDASHNADEEALVAYFDSVNAERGRVRNRSQPASLPRTLSTKVVLSNVLVQHRDSVSLSPHVQHQSSRSSVDASARYQATGPLGAPPHSVDTHLAGSTSAAIQAVAELDRPVAHVALPVDDVQLQLDSCRDVAPKGVPSVASDAALGRPSRVLPPPLPLGNIRAGLPTPLRRYSQSHDTPFSDSHVPRGVEQGNRRQRRVMDRGQLRWHDNLALCLNRPIDESGAMQWERTFQVDSAVGWRRFLRISLCLALGVVALFLASDYTNAYFSSANSTFTSILIVRYGIMAPVILMMLGITYLPQFRQSWACTQISTTFVMLLIGACIIAISVIGGQPGYGVLALYVVYCLNFSILALALRIMSLFVLVVAFTVASNITSLNSSRNDTAIFFVYLMAFTIGESIPVVMRERAVRENYYRQWRIHIEKRKLHDEQAKSNKLLENLLPASIVSRLRLRSQQLIADKFDEVTILWTDMKGFTDFSSKRSPLEVVAFLNAMFSTFDRILDKYGIQKIEVLGDAFFVVGGCPVKCDDHAERCANAAIEMLMHMPILRRFASADINMRIGLHTGPVVAGVVGIRDPRYHLFGSTPPYANAMESHGSPGKIHCSAATFAKLSSRQLLRANAFVDHYRLAAAGLPTTQRIGLVSTIMSKGRSGVIHSVEGSSSRDLYPRVSLELLDEYYQWRKDSADRVASDDSYLTSHVGSHHSSRSDTPKVDAAAKPSIDGHAAHSEVQRVPTAAEGSRSSAMFAPRIVPELGDGAVRSQVQQWRGNTFMGWEIRSCMVQNGLIYSNIPVVATNPATPIAVTSPPPLSATRGRSDAAQAPELDELLGIFSPEDPDHKFFGPGAGFFSFEERPNIDIKGTGRQTTYFVSRAEPPLVPELARSLSKLQRDLEEWHVVFGTHKTSKASPPKPDHATVTTSRPPAAVAKSSDVHLQGPNHVNGARAGPRMVPKIAPDVMTAHASNATGILNSVDSATGFRDLAYSVPTRSQAQHANALLVTHRAPIAEFAVTTRSVSGTSMTHQYVADDCVRDWKGESGVARSILSGSSAAVIGSVPSPHGRLAADIHSVQMRDPRLHSRLDFPSSY